MTDKPLSERDENILNILFDRETQPFGQVHFSCLRVPGHQFKLDEQQMQEIISNEVKAIQLAEAELLDDAEKLLTQTIEKYPEGRLTLWNNRAQTRRLAGNVEGALSDLAHVINTQTTASPGNFSSPAAIRALSDAHVHRATIYLLLARSLGYGGGLASIPTTLQAESNETLEEWASRDFASAAKYGNGLGRVMASRTNPFAKMCGAIVQTALQRDMCPTESS
jgi:hypothetical protein